MATKPYNQGKPPCYHSHKILELGKGFLHGGNCSKPVVKDAWGYIGLESMNTRTDPRAFPWNQGASFTYPIVNGGIPDDAKSFLNLVDWIAEGLEKGRSIHVGCIGGHGRTGLVLSAVALLMGKGPDATQWVRDNYCKKAVETAAQVKFLDEVFGITPVIPYYTLKNMIPDDVKDDRLN